MKFTSLRAVFFCGLLLAFNACKPKAIDELSDSGTALKNVLAIETAQVAHAKRQVVLIVPNAAQGPAASLAGDFKTALEKKGLSVQVRPVDLGDPMHYNEFGLKAADFLDVLQKHSGAGAIVSMVGAPLVRPNDLNKISAGGPAVLVIATRQIGLAPGVPTNPTVLEHMIAAKIIHLAIVDGPGSSDKPDGAYKNFDQHFRILRSKP
ncbi:MAG: hypothetical protein ABIR24_00850 [Verrucomicrobiota bacterium]